MVDNLGVIIEVSAVVPEANASLVKSSLDLTLDRVVFFLCVQVDSSLPHHFSPLVICIQRVAFAIFCPDYVRCLFAFERLVMMNLARRTPFNKSLIIRKFISVHHL